MISKESKKMMLLGVESTIYKLSEEDENKQKDILVKYGYGSVFAHLSALIELQLKECSSDPSLGAVSETYRHFVNELSHACEWLETHYDEEVLY